MTESRRVRPPTPTPDAIVITVQQGRSIRVLEIPGRHFDAELRSPLGAGIPIGFFHGAVVKLQEPAR